MTSTNRSQDWLLQAQNDCQFAEASIKLGFYSQVCFIAQQAVKKLKIIIDKIVELHK